MVNNRDFQLSCRLFWGYKTTLDLDYFDTTDQILIAIKSGLDNFLRNANLICLAEDLEKMKFHSPSIESILISNNPHDIIYICDHSHECCGNSTDECCTNSTTGCTTNNNDIPVNITASNSTDECCINITTECNTTNNTATNNNV